MVDAYIKFFLYRRFRIDQCLVRALSALLRCERTDGDRHMQGFAFSCEYVSYFKNLHCVDTEQGRVVFVLCERFDKS